MSISFGRINHNENVKWENEDGTICDIPVCWAIHRNFKYSGTERMRLPINLLFPSLIKYHIMGKDRLNGRNQNAIENCIFKISNERKACKQLAQPSEKDLHDLLLREDVYKGDDLKLCYDLRMICLAGTETVNVSTANLIYFMTIHKQF